MRKLCLLLLLLVGTTPVCTASLWRDKLTASDGANLDRFGGTISISGDVCIVGADGANSAYIFRFDGNKWIQEQKIDAPDESTRFGVSVSIDQDVCVIGGGSIYVFRYNGSTWIQEDKLIDLVFATDTSVSISNDVCIVRTHYDLLAGNNVYVFRYDGFNWNQESELQDPNGLDNNDFGKSVSISDDICTIGAPQDNDSGDNSGAAYIFRFNGDYNEPNWIEDQKLIASDGTDFDYFGSSVSIDDDVCIVGTGSELTAGSAYIFRNNGDQSDPNWIQEQKLLPSDGDPNNHFGSSVSLSDGVCVVGADGDDDNGQDSGSAYVFRYNGIDWIQTDKLTAFDGETDDFFGTTVSIDTGNIVVGAPCKETYAGAAYTFRPCPKADFNGDCFVSLEDLLIFVPQWLTGVNPL